MVIDPIQPFLEHQDALILDGGLATELEARGHDLNDRLWSARLLASDPAAIREVHLAYFQAGADCGISASYQASIPGFQAIGMPEREAVELLQLSVQFVMQAREQFWSRRSGRFGRLRPIVAASVGPYGAYLADGSEYRGDYLLDEGQLVAWHRRRWHVLANSGADILACETIPSYREARAFCRLLAETPQVVAWFSFSCRDGNLISDGTPLSQLGAWLAGEPQILGVGINCTSTRFIPPLIDELRQVTDKHIVVYPNSGEEYDAESRSWAGSSEASEFGTFSREWRKAGAAIIGGCCRTGPEHIQQISDRLRRSH
jgi:homocysteine S-methyltransferase